MPITVNLPYDTKKALLMGKANSGRAEIQVTDEDLAAFTAAEREELLAHHDYSSNTFKFYDGVPEATIPALRELLNASIADKKKKAEYEVKAKAEQRQRHIANLEEWLDADKHTYHFDYIPNRNFTEDSEKLPTELVTRCQAERDRRIAERDAAKAAEEKAKTEKEAAKLAHISEWMAQQEDGLLAEQWAAGELCREDAVEMLAASVLDPFGEKWSRLGESGGAQTIRDQSSGTCDRCESEIYSKQVKCLPRGVYPVWRELKARLPDGAQWSFIEAYCTEEGCENTHSDYGVQLTIPSGPFHFQRTVKLVLGS